MKRYHYEVNECIRGVFEAKNKREAKEYCQSLAERFFPTRGIETLKITRMKKKEPLYTEA